MNVVTLVICLKCAYLETELKLCPYADFITFELNYLCPD